MQGFLIGEQMTPDDRRAAIRQQLAQQIMGQPARNPVAGMGQLALGLGMGIERMHGPFPETPNRGRADLATRFGNLFSFGHNGGLY